MRQFSLVLLIAVFSTGCATLLSSKTVDVPVTSEPPGAEIVVDGVVRGVTPSTLQRERKRPYTVILKKQGEADRLCHLDSGPRVGFVVLDIVLGMVPAVVDGLTGAWSGLTHEAVTARYVPGDVAPAAPASALEQQNVPACMELRKENAKNLSAELRAVLQASCERESGKPVQPAQVTNVLECVPAAPTPAPTPSRSTTIQPRS